MKGIISRCAALALLVVLSAPVAGLAQRGPHHSRPGGPGRGEMAAYVQANVLPVVRQQRQQLEPQLRPADRAQLATYRSQLQDLRARSQALRHSFKPAQPADEPAQTRPALTNAQREQLRQLRTETRTIMERVGQLARHYDAPIRQLAQQVQPQKAQWAADLKAIAAKNAAPEQREKMARSQQPGPGPAHGHGSLGRYFRPAAFLLMNPAAIPAAGTEAGSTSFYPNPAAASSQLTYQVTKAGPVSVDLLDQNGARLRTLVPAYQAEKGPQTQQLDLHDLPAGAYFYKITTKSGTETRRFVKN